MAIEVSPPEGVFFWRLEEAPGHSSLLVVTVLTDTILFFKSARARLFFMLVFCVCCFVRAGYVR